MHTVLNNNDDDDNNNKQPACIEPTSLLLSLAFVNLIAYTKPPLAAAKQEEFFAFKNSVL